MSVTTNNKIWLVTGASSGFGFFTTKAVLEKGYTVVAASRKLDSLKELAAKYPDTLVIVQTDVTKEDQVAALFSTIKERFGQLDIVWNNAGNGTLGEIETTPIADAKATFDLNVWGAVHVTRAAVAFFRDVNKVKGGRLLQNSSAIGLFTMPSAGYYAASKWALEAITESLAAELDPSWNIQVSLVEPGPFRTSFQANTAISAETLKEAAESGRATVEWVKGFKEKPEDFAKGDPAKFATRLIEYSELETLPLRALFGAADMAATIDAKIARDKAEREQQGDRWEKDLSVDE